MPVKKASSDNKKTTKEPKKNKKDLMNTIVKTVNNEEEHIILQLPITQTRIDNIINKDNILKSDNISELNKSEPSPYEPNCYYINDNNINDNNNLDNIQNNEINNENVNNMDNNFNNMNCLDNKNCCCFWCCHPIDGKTYGMPYKYDSINDTYILYGSFCSLQCANAYNFSVHCGSDKVWEINSWIQMLGKRYGFIKTIRPSPSKYLLKMFNGPLSIEEFRKLHKDNNISHILNLPPMISISSGYEIVNTTYIKNISDNMESEKIKKNKYVSKNTIDSKLNLIIS